MPIGDVRCGVMWCMVFMVDNDLSFLRNISEEAALCCNLVRVVKMLCSGWVLT